MPDRSPPTTVARTGYHCPSWCIVPADRHTEELPQWQGSVEHRSDRIAVPGGFDTIQLTMMVDPDDPLSTERGLYIGDRWLSVPEALGLVAEVTRALTALELTPDFADVETAERLLGDDDDAYPAD